MQQPANKLLTVDTKMLSRGMYVAELDRPWLETPFVFRGFEISDRAEIEILRSHCRIVYVDPDKSRLSREQLEELERAVPVEDSGTRRLRRLEEPPGFWGRRLQSLVLRLDVARWFGVTSKDADGRYQVVSTVRREARKAEAAFEQLNAFHARLLSAVSRFGRVSIDATRKAVAPAIDSILRNPNAMAWVVFSGKSAPEKHNRAVATSVWCTMFGRHLAFDRERLEDLAIGGLLLDVGYANLPADVMQVGGALTLDQRLLLETHVAEGLRILQASEGVSENVLDMVRCHQERGDGSGYPAGLTARQIPNFGLIAAIADCYDAMTSERAYSSAAAGYDAARSLNDMRGLLFPAEVVEQFLRTVGMFPTGSIVELNDGRIAVVLEQNPDNALRPKIMIVLDRSKKRLKKPKVEQLADLEKDATSRKAVWIVEGHGHGAFGVEPRNLFG